MVKQLAIENHDDIPILIGHRLLAVRETNDAQPTRRERDSRVKKETFFVGAAMREGTRHSPHNFVGDWSFLGEVNNTCDATHVNYGRTHLEVSRGGFRTGCSPHCETLAFCEVKITERSQLGEYGFFAGTFSGAFNGLHL